MRALRPATVRLVNSDFTSDVPSPAYDTLASNERREWVLAHPDSYLTVTRSPGDEPSMTSRELLVSGRAALDRLRAKGAFDEAEPPRLLLYELSIDGHQQTALVAALSVDAIANGTVRPHEQIFPERTKTLADHLEVVGAQSSPLALAHAPIPQLVATIEAAKAAPPLLDFTGPEDLRQRIWSFPDIDALDLLAETPLYLLDGHHRAAAAVAYLGRSEADPEGHEAWVLAALFPSDDLRVYGFDRRVLDPRFSTDEILERLGRHTTLTPAAGPFRPTVGNQFGVYTGGQWYRAEVDTVRIDQPLADLAPVALQYGILEPVFGISDPQTDHRLEHLPGARSAQGLARHIDDEGGVAFTVAPVSPEQLMVVADRGQVLPPKSTYFWPKVRSGIFLREL